MSFKRTAFLIISILIQFSEQQITQNQKLKVTVLYESPCGDTEAFIKDQLLANYNTLKECISVELVPYGKAEHTPGKNTWIFKCERGEKVCEQIRYHACGIKYATTEEVQIKFVNCLMVGSGAVNYPAVVETCAKDFGVDYNKIKTCLASSEVDILLAGHGDRTRRLAGKLTFVPTILFNEIYSQPYQDAALNQFAAVVQQLQMSCGMSCGSCPYNPYPYQPCVFPCFPYVYYK